jgi:hypothetical protein
MLHGQFFCPADVLPRAIRRLQRAAQAEVHAFKEGKIDRLSDRTKSALESAILSELKSRKKKDKDKRR